MVELAEQAAAIKAAGGDFSHIKVDRSEIRQREDEVREAYAILESFVGSEVQIAAFECMEAVTKAFNFAAVMSVEEARALLAFYQRQYESFATEFNKEIEDYNAIIYSSFTPIWRAILHKARRKPLPYHIRSQITALRNPQEKVERSTVERA